MTVLRDYAAGFAQPTLPFGAGVFGAGGARFDEVIAPDGTLRPAWKGMAEAAFGLTPDELRRVDGEIVRFLADDGVTYVPPGSDPVAWRLDPVPLVIDAETWAPLGVGLSQRAELLNALADDLYGLRRLLRTGIVPAAAVFAHAGYLRPLVGAPATGDRSPLLLAATDLGRDAAGDWHVLADRVQAPSGLGFAMENRRVLSQVLPELYQERELHRLEPYFAALRAALLAAAPAGVDDPRVVVLTPGTHSETAYDQAFLASALGFPLVQGEDLTVRDGRVWIAPAGGSLPTERVDVILRRVDAEWCDPLEFRGNSRLGVAGLTDIARRGGVTIANGLGAGVLENPALLPYMPAICEALLGEQLRLPQVPTWWLGDEAQRAAALEKLDAPASLDPIAPEVIVRAIDAPAADLAGFSRDALRARIDAAPEKYVLQERLPLSQAPVWSSPDGIGGADPQPLVLRGFALRYGSSYRPLVGGLATVTAPGVRRPSALSPQTKDVWVLKDAPDDPDQGLVEVEAVELARAVPALAPRALEDMYWSGRYAERTEDLLRLLLVADTHLDRLRADAGSGRAEVARTLVQALQSLAGARSNDPEAELRSLLLDVGRPGSAAQGIERLRNALGGVRDQLSSDTWRVFAHTQRAATTLRSSGRSHHITETAGRMLTAILSLQGVTASMMRDAGWHAIELGRYLERGVQLCRLLRATVIERRVGAVERDTLESTLVAAESSITFRRRYRGAVRAAGLIELLLMDPDNPRSLGFALHEIGEHLAALPLSSGSTRPERLVEELAAQVRDLEASTLATSSVSRRGALEDLLIDVQAQLGTISDAITELHFATGQAPQPLTALDLTEVAVDA